MPDGKNRPVEDYIEKIKACIEKNKIDIRPGEEFSELSKNQQVFSVVTRENQYQAASVVLAFGSNIPVDLGVYGEAKTIARKLENPADHIGAPTLVIGSGNTPTLFSRLSGMP
jgi:predicted flavoprotein YhiN